MDPTVHYRIYKCPPPVPILSQLNSAHDLPSHIPSSFPTKSLYTVLLSPYVLHVPPISLLSICSPKQCFVRSTDHLARQCVVLSKPLETRPVYPKYFLQHPILKQSHPTSLIQCERPSFTLRQNYRSV
jgi:hypothetical protein